MSTRDEVARWVAAGIIDAATGERILAFEEQERTPAPERPTFLEAIVYLAVAIIGVGVLVLTASTWDDLGAGGRVGIPAFAAAAALAAGYWLREGDSSALLRGASAAWLASAALASIAAGVWAAEADWRDENVILATAAAATVMSALLWAALRMDAQVVGLGGAAFLLAIALVARTDNDAGISIFGLLLAGFGLGGLIAAEAGELTPYHAGQAVAALCLAIGGFAAGLPPGPGAAAVITFASAAILLGAGIRFASLIYVAVGVITAFAGLLTVILRHIDDPTLAGLALVATGIALLMTIVALTRLRPWRRDTDGREPRDAAEPPGLPGDAEG